MYKSLSTLKSELVELRKNAYEAKTKLKQKCEEIEEYMWWTQGNKLFLEIDSVLQTKAISKLVLEYMSIQTCPNCQRTAPVQSCFACLANYSINHAFWLFSPEWDKIEMNSNTDSSNETLLTFKAENDCEYLKFFADYLDELDPGKWDLLRNGILRIKSRKALLLPSKVEIRKKPIQIRSTIEWVQEQRQYVLTSCLQQAVRKRKRIRDTS